MRYQPSAIAAEDLSIASKHSVGEEKKLYISREPVIELGRLAFNGPGDTTYTADPIFTVPTSGVDLQAKVDRELVSDSPVVVTVVGTKVGGGLLSGTATFAPPSYASNKRCDFGEGAAQDIIPNLEGERFASITSVSATFGKKWSNVKICQLPSADSWQLINSVEGFDPKIGTNPAHPIPDGMDGTANVVRARSNPNTVSVTAKHRSVVDGLQRFAGRECSVRVDVVKQGKVLVERYVLGTTILEANPNFPDTGDATQAGEGMFEEFFGFYAK